MIKADYLRPLRTANADYAQTELLKAEFRRCRQARKTFFLTGDDLDRVFRWKLVPKQAHLGFAIVHLGIFSDFSSQNLLARHQYLFYSS